MKINTKSKKWKKRSTVMLVAIIFVITALVVYQKTKINVTVREGESSEAASVPTPFATIKIDPTQVNTDNQDVTITLRLFYDDNFQDNLPGVCFAGYCSLPGGAKATHVILRSALDPKSFLEFSSFNLNGYTDKFGTAESKMKLPKGSASGDWKVEYLLIVDKLGNSKKYDYNELSKDSANIIKITNLSTKSPITVPKVNSVKMSLSSSSVHKGFTNLIVDANIAVSDSRGLCIPGKKCDGVTKKTEFQISQPVFKTNYISLTNFQLVSGNVQNGNYRASIELSTTATSSLGTYKAYRFLVNDCSGNTVNLDYNAMSKISGSVLEVNNTELNTGISKK